MQSNRRRKRTQRQVTETEAQFEQTFREVAAAAGYVNQFHVLNRSLTGQVQQILAVLQNAGMHEAASMLRRVGHAKVTSSGFPDWVLRHETHGICIAELKSDRRDAQPTEDQIDWLRSFAVSLRPPGNPHAPSRAHVWRPQHWSAIETQLGLMTSPTPCPCQICDWMRVSQGLAAIGSELSHNDGIDGSRQELAP